MKTLTKEINIISEAPVQFPILPNGSGWKSTENDKLSLFESGEGKVLFLKMIKAIEAARQLICLQSFLIQDNAIIDVLVKAVKEKGVKVYVLSSVEARLKETIEEEEAFIKSKYIDLLDSKFKNHFVHRSAENFHAKYILIDPITKPIGFICTCNFTDNGFTKNPELTVELNKAQCEDLFKVFVYHFWEHSSDEQTATNEFAKVKEANKFTLPKLENILLTSPNISFNTLNKSLSASIKKATKSISFSTFQLDKNIELIRLILDKARQDVSVTLFCRPIERLFNEHLKELLGAGVEVYFHPLIHAKSLLIDNKDAFIFTANLTVNGLERGMEVGVKLNKEQIQDLSTIHQCWRNNFKAKAIKLAYMKDLKEILSFKDKKLVTISLAEDTKTDRRKVVKVAELFSLFRQKHEIRDSLVKSLNLQLIADIEDLPAKYKAKKVDKFELIQVEEDNEKKSKFIIIGDNFTPDDLELIQEWKDLKIYFQNS